MKKEQKMEMFSMRLDGYTLQEIGDEFGISKEYVSHILLLNDNKNKESLRDRCMYPAIANWIIKHESSIGDFARRISASHTSVSNWLIGKGHPSKKSIDATLKLTGLTYEVAFAEKRRIPHDEQTEKGPHPEAADPAAGVAVRHGVHHPSILPAGRGVPDPRRG